ncbi:hypothetical protein XVE_1243 [Xanthomonas vesicatoria ATCC 35937]|uniref:Uncharacterized protein n=1 Tax=Xanthomonas vesicatoria ATCC 35937 TaxID=925775 RepID=F0BAX6_9XANT|nr:hypothetical protein XVE_1243 [Xanthomonas vesicatoria ATCC 35937]
MARTCMGDATRPPSLQRRSDSTEHAPHMRNVGEPDAAGAKPPCAAVSLLQCNAQNAA